MVLKNGNSSGTRTDVGDQNGITHGVAKGWNNLVRRFDMNCECPNCGAEDAYFDVGTGCYNCPQCGHVWGKGYGVYSRFIGINMKKF